MTPIRSASERIEKMLAHGEKSGAREHVGVLVRHLRRVEVIEARLASNLAGPAEVRELAEHVHSIMNEVHYLNLQNEFRAIYRLRGSPASASS